MKNATRRKKTSDFKKMVVLNEIIATVHGVYVEGERGGITGSFIILHLVAKGR
jgi:hypothetical protein